MDRGKYRGIPVDTQGNIAQMILPDNSAGNKPFVHGAMFEAQGKIYIIPQDATLEDVDGEWGLFGFVEVHPDTVGQYTGTEAEIYEGDRLLDERSNLKYTVCFGVTEFGRGWYIESEDSHKKYRFDYSVTKMKVIGTIHTMGDITK